MTDSSAYPSDKKLSLHNVSVWDHHVHEVISAYSDMGTAIRRNIPFVLRRPSTEDLFPGTLFRMYNLAPVVPYDPLDPLNDAPLPALDAASHASFGSAMTLYLN